MRALWLFSRVAFVLVLLSDNHISACPHKHRFKFNGTPTRRSVMKFYSPRERMHVTDCTSHKDPASLYTRATTASTSIYLPGRRCTFNIRCNATVTFTTTTAHWSARPAMLCVDVTFLAENTLYMHIYMLPTTTLNTNSMPAQAVTRSFSMRLYNGLLLCASLTITLTLQYTR